MIRVSAAAAILLLALPLPSPVSAQEAGSSLEVLDRDARALVDRCSPAVVRVEFERTPRLRVTAVTEAERARIEERFRDFAPREIVGASGFVVGEPGMVATAAAGSAGATRVRVLGPGGAMSEATLVGADELAGVALLRVDSLPGVAPLRLSGREVRVATLSLLLAPEERGTAAVLQFGFVTSPRRAFGLYDAWLVSSVPVEAGQIGAPLLDAAGEVLGMAVAARERSRAMFGISPSAPGTPVAAGETGPVGERLRRLTEFTVERKAPFSTFVPASELRRILEDLKGSGRVRRGMLGVRLQRGEPVVHEVVPGTPAEAAGVAAGDRVLSLDGTAVEDRETLTAFLQRRAPGTPVALRVRSADGTEKDLNATLAELPVPPPARQLFNGISVQARDEGGKHVVAVSVDEDSAAWRAGLRPEDRIVEIEGRPILSQEDFERASTGPAALAESVKILVYRRGEAERRTLVLR